jgi:hypothetical protein
VRRNYPYLGIEGYSSYSFDNKEWIPITFVTSFTFMKSWFGIYGYLAAGHCDNNDTVSQLIHSNKRFNLKIDFKENGEGELTDTIYIYNVKITNNGMDCGNQNSGKYEDVIKFINFKAKKYKVVR